MDNLNRKTSYVSIFRINKIPIIPPLITPERRKELKNIKEAAIRIEQKLANKKSHLTSFEVVNESGATCTTTNTSITTTDTYDYIQRNMENSILQLSNLMLKDNKTKYQKLECSKLSKSETIIYDNIENSIIVPLTKEEEQQTHNEIIKELKKCPLPTIQIQLPTPIKENQNDLNMNPITLFNTSRNSFMDSESSQDDYITTNESNTATSTPRRSATISSFNKVEEDYNFNGRENSLTRSTSFTLEGPSTALLEHIRQQADVEILKSAEKKNKKVIASEKLIMNKKSTGSPYEVKAKNKFYPYDRLCSKPVKPITKVPPPKFNRKTIIGQVIKKNKNVTEKNKIVSNCIEIDVLKDIPIALHQKYFQLLADQQQQESLIKKTFAEEQQFLLEQLKKSNQKTVLNQNNNNNNFISNKNHTRASTNHDFGKIINK